MSSHPRIRRLAVSGAAVGATTAAASTVGWVAGAAYFARKVLVPDHRKPDDQQLLEIGPDRIVLGLSADSSVPGHYGLWFDQGAGHLRLGHVLDVDADARRVTRALLAVDTGAPLAGPARWNTYYWWASPEICLGLDTEHTLIRGELGPLPAWVVPAAGGERRRWAILVHGRGARREEAVRAIPTLRAAGWSVLVPGYRNDEGVASGPDGRYNLGLSEWRDVESAVRYAVHAGAHEVVLGGWSMGGAIVLQFLDRSRLAGVVSRVFLDAPVVDWNDVLAFHGRINHVPAPVANLSRTLMGRRWGKRLVGVHDVLDVARTDWVARAGELRHPILLIHSADDDFVPVGPSRALAAARPDLVTYEEFTSARHCAEWNVDQARWEAALAHFLRDGGDGLSA